MLLIDNGSSGMWADPEARLWTEDQSKELPPL
jgi:hypothetical protein